MKIFYACDHQPFPGNHLWYHNLFMPLLDLGHEVVPFEYDLTRHFLQASNPTLPEHRANIEAWREQLEDELIRQIEAEHQKRPVDLFFSYFYSAFCRPEIIRRIHDLGIVTVNWYCNGSYQFDLVSDIAPAYDFCLVPEKFRLQDYRRIGANPIYCQEAANPNIYKPYPVSQEFDVTFVGQGYGDRIEYICHLLEERIDVRVWGPRWEEWGGRFRGQRAEGGTCRGNGVSECRGGRGEAGSGTGEEEGRRDEGGGYGEGLKGLVRKVLGRKTFVPAKRLIEIAGPPLSDEEMVKMYSRSKINLGFSSCGDTHLGGQRIVQVRLRDFEVPMSGGFYMVEHMEELEEFFVIGREIVCYRSKEELVDKIRYYLRHDGEREKIRQAGYQRCLRDHTWQKRLADAFCLMSVESMEEPSKRQYVP
jgi:spore maturation protein CgeB